jgi:hypothetical protein
MLSPSLKGDAHGTRSRDLSLLSRGSHHPLMPSAFSLRTAPSLNIATPDSICDLCLTTAKS